MTPQHLPAGARVLVVALRRLGDVLLTTPLIRSMRRAWPDAVIDVLVFSDTAAILDGNPDIDRVIVMPPRPTAAQSLALACRLWRRYALAVSTQAGDRPSFFAAVAGATRVALIEESTKGRLKRRLFHRSVTYVPGIHRVEEMLRFADVLGIARVPQVVAPAASVPVEGVDGDYAVIHAAPFFRYKQWAREGWRALAAALAARGLKIIATGGPGTTERAYLDEIWSEAGTDVHRFDGRLTWPELASVLARARVYVGPDTSVTHLAAATGCPTVALFGPTDPRLWGPWPAQGLSEPWRDAADIQRRGNVWLVQNPLPCMPCQLEGCERRLDSYSACLDELPWQRVIAAVDEAIAAG
jgi:heptosyltransferase-3